jgi:hypothetical protein
MAGFNWCALRSSNVLEMLVLVKRLLTSDSASFVHIFLWYSKNADLVRRFLKASSKGFDFAVQNPPQAASLFTASTICFFISTYKPFTNCS